MIEAGMSDLSEHFDIQLVECDYGLDFPGYSVETVHGANDWFRIVKVSEQT
jgi:hypothetical protein